MLILRIANISINYQYIFIFIKNWMLFLIILLTDYGYIFDIYLLKLEIPFLC